MLKEFLALTSLGALFVVVADFSFGFVPVGLS